MRLHRLLASITLLLFLSVLMTEAYAQQNPLFIVKWNFDESTPSMASVYAPLADNSYYIINYPDGIYLNFDDRRERYLEIYYQQAAVQNLIARIELTSFKKPAWDNPAAFRVAEYVVDSVAIYEVTLTGDYKSIGSHGANVAFNAKETGAEGLLTGDDAIISEITIPKSTVDALPGKPNRFAASWAGESKDSRGEFENGNYIIMLPTKKYPNGAELELGIPTAPKPLVLEYKNLSLGEVVSTCRISLARLSEQPGGSATADLELYCTPGSGTPLSCQPQAPPSATGGCIHESLSNQQVVFEHLSLIIFASTKISLEAEMRGGEFTVNNVKVPAELLLKLSGAAAIEEAKQDATAPAAAPPPAPAPPCECTVTPNFTINGQAVDASKNYTVAELQTAKANFSTTCKFTQATFELWRNPKTSGQHCTIALCVQLASYRGVATNNTELGVYPSKFSDLQAFTGNAPNFLVEVKPEGCGTWVDSLPKPVKVAPPKSCAEQSGKTCASNESCSTGSFVAASATMRCCLGECKGPELKPLYISRITPAGGTATTFTTAGGNKEVTVPYEKTFELEVKNVNAAGALYLVKDNCPATEAELTAPFAKKTKEGIAGTVGATSDLQTFKDIKASELSSTQKLSVCQYINNVLRPDSVTVNVALPPCTNLICALARIDIRFVQQVFGEAPSAAVAPIAPTPASAPTQAPAQQTPILTITKEVVNSVNRPKLSWTSVSGAAKYYIYGVLCGKPMCYTTQLIIDTDLTIASFKSDAFESYISRMARLDADTINWLATGGSIKSYYKVVAVSTNTTVITQSEWVKFSG